MREQSSPSNLMDEFKYLSEFYDECVGADYKTIASYIDQKLHRHFPSAKYGIDIGCGSGTLCFELLNGGYSMIGIDISDAMLSEAVKKAAASPNLVFSLQDMTDFKIPYTADFMVSTLDCLNYLSDLDDVDSFFGCCARQLCQGGLLIIDCNTLYKYTEILNNHNFVYETQKAFFVWENEFDGHNMYYDLTYFVRDNQKYQRFEEHQIQTYFLIEDICSKAQKYGFRLLSTEDDYSNKKVTDTTERIVCTFIKE